MNENNTVLSSLYIYLYQCMFYDNVNNIFTLKNIADFKKIIGETKAIPQHLNRFISELLNGATELDFQIMLKSLYEESSNCNLCIDCKKCSQFFCIEICKKFSLECKNILPNNYNAFDSNPPIVFRKTPNSIGRFFIENQTIKNKFKETINTFGINSVNKNHLIILKGMSSSSPFIYNSLFQKHKFTGGGIYLNWNGIGIAIDPGYGFIENLNENQLTINDIDVVIITHYHIDHTYDIRLIDDLNMNINPEIYDFYDKKEEEKYIKLKKQGLLLKDDSFEPSHKIKWYVDEISFKLLFNSFNKLTNEIITIQPNQNIIINNFLSFITFPTEHVNYHKIDDENAVKRYKDTHTFGIKLVLDNHIKFGYTSDTAINDNIINGLKECNYIVANISGIKKEDYLLISQKDNHLGYMGCKKIIDIVNPKLMIVSEFWNGNYDIRFDVCCQLNKEAKNTFVIPGDIGLNINLKEDTIRCSKCGSFSKSSDIQVARQNSAFNDISYICNNCIYGHKT